ncbi:MAG: hypothetical protein LKG40_01505 [Lachnospiraceae bacterium]|jgi:hypothetical protein|nr:hypothetical protein [Lachnospiraceae bacterium]MCI1328030.1 hypothetical protein [Lachnospiraceae bacterium]
MKKYLIIGAQISIMAGLLIRIRSKADWLDWLTVFMLGTSIILNLTEGRKGK